MTKNRMTATLTCPPKPKPQNRTLICQAISADVANLFKILANDTRVRLLHALAIHKELCVSDLVAHLEMKPQAISNQLQKLTAAKMLTARRDGNSILYKIVDPCIPSLLDLGLCLLEDSSKLS